MGREGRLPWDIVVGVITNSDNRIPGILSSFGLSVSPRRYGMDPSISHLKFEEDIDFVVMSYDVGHEKPSPSIYGAAADLAGVSPSQEEWCLHVGDNLMKDFQAAENAGWDSMLLCNPADVETLQVQNIPHITDLLELKEHLSSDSAEIYRRSRQILRERRIGKQGKQ